MISESRLIQILDREVRDVPACAMSIPQIKVEGSNAELEFFLPKGSYATVILREYMKGEAIESI